jgi:hypothetical protein
MDSDDRTLEYTAGSVNRLSRQASTEVFDSLSRMLGSDVPVEASRSHL